MSALVVGFAGYGNVSQGAQEILDILPIKEISLDQLDDIQNKKDADCHTLYKVIFKEQDIQLIFFDLNH